MRQILLLLTLTAPHIAQAEEHIVDDEHGSPWFTTTPLSPTSPNRTKRATELYPKLDCSLSVTAWS